MIDSSFSSQNQDYQIEMDKSNLKNPTYESISSSLPTYESFASQQNNAMEDENVDFEAVDFDENKRKRKAPSKPKKTTSECWKYFDAKFEPDENGLVIKMAYCKWCDAVLKADSKMHDKVGNKLSGGEDELTKYLKEPRLELEDDEEFDILNWWKVNSPRFPIVSRMAKDILCIQVSTVASESAFTASGRVLDPYRNSLAPSIVEALVCTQYWIRTSSRNITLDTLEDLMKDDEVAKEIQEELEKQKGEHGNSRML